MTLLINPEHYQAMCDRARREGRDRMQFLLTLNTESDNEFNNQYFLVVKNKATGLYKVFYDRAEWEDNFGVQISNAPMDNPLVYSESREITN